MGGPLTVIVFVAAGSASEPTTLAIERAANEALGRDARVVVRESMGAPTDAEALASSAEATAGESAVVEVTWGDGGHRLAMIRVHLDGDPRWIVRAIGFGPNDAVSERARTLGFALASMIPERPADLVSAPSPGAPAPPAAPSRVSPPTHRDVPPREPDEVATVNEPAVAEPPRSRRLAVDVFVAGAAGIQANLETLGAGAALETYVLPALGLRFGGSVRAGDVGTAEATAVALLGSAGVSVHPWRITPARTFDASFRADYVVEDQGVSHSSPGGSGASMKARAVSGVDVFAEGEWRCASALGVLVGLGFEEILATTHVDLNGVRAGTLPPSSAVAEAGLRLWF